MSEVRSSLRDDKDNWCGIGSHRGRRGRKRRYTNIHEAWLDAFVLFMRHGAVMTPYRCAPTKRGVAQLIVRPHPNPWAFRPYWHIRVLEERPRTKSCGGWHLTKKSTDLGLPFLHR